MMIYDIRTVDNAKKTLATLFNCHLEVIENLVKINKEMEVDYFLKQLNKSLNDFDLEELEIIGVHSTTNNDQCASIIKTGLINLKKALSVKSSLNTYLKDNGINIDIYTKKLTYNGKVYNLIDCGNSKLHYKIFGDCSLDCFLCISKNCKLDSKLKARPKILSEIEQYLQIEGLHDKWSRNSTPYMITFKEHAYNFNRYQFSADGSEDGMKYTLVYYALRVIYTQQQCDIQIDLVGEYQIPSNHILEINAVEV